MNIRFRQLDVTTKHTLETFDLSRQVTFLHGPIGAGKSSVARLIDFCFGGRLERTPAIQLHFVSARLLLDLGAFRVQLERSADDLQSVRVTWVGANGDRGSVNAPLQPASTPIIGEAVFTLSDLVFWFTGIEPIKVRRSKRDPDSPLVRLSIRDILWYCYLKQDKLDSSFFRLEDTARKYKSMDAMRFVTGLYSERLNDLEIKLAAAQDAQRTKREAVAQIREFLRPFELGSEGDLSSQIEAVQKELAAAMLEREVLDTTQAATTHVVEPLRTELRELSRNLGEQTAAIEDLRQRIRDQESLRSELITSKVKASRADAASGVLAGVSYRRCPCCGASVNPDRFAGTPACYLCGTNASDESRTAVETEVLQRDLIARIDDLAESIARHKRELSRAEKRLEQSARIKVEKDAELSRQLAHYDSTFVAGARAADRRVAALQERIASLERLGKLPAAMEDLEREAGRLQGDIDNLRSALTQERGRLQGADQNIRAIEETFLDVMCTIGFPGVDRSDRVELDSRLWEPKVLHSEGDVVWGFFDAGSGGKKTLFNVCYALALHTVARERGLPLPPFLIIDSPTKNFGRDINRPLALAMFHRAYTLAAKGTQLLLIDSDFVAPEDASLPVTNRLMEPGNPEHPPLISYYTGP